MPIHSDMVWDPLRKKSVRLTPEEEVRQWFISVRNGLDYRADIVVYDRQARPLLVAECKRPEVELTQEVVDQAIRYNNALDVRYIVITNGLKTFMFERGSDGFVFVEKAPLWEDMLCRR